MRLTGISSILLFAFPSNFLSTIPIPVLIPMNSVYASHSHGTHGNSRIMHTCSAYPSVILILYALNIGRSDWNSRGTHGGTYYKSPAVEAKNIFLHCNASITWCLKFCNMTKSGGGDNLPRSKFWRDLSPVPRDLRSWL